MEFIPTKIPGCWEIAPDVRGDERGFFVKTFHEPTFAAKGLAVHYAEEFYSLSKRGVLRGLHFHAPPRAHAKLVHCPEGEILDAVVDLRRGSPAFGSHVLLEIDSKKRNMIYIPEGLAHGFCVRSAEALVVYKTTTPYSPEHDAGIRWDSAGIRWPDPSPIVSDRDGRFPALAGFESPFTYRP